MYIFLALQYPTQDSILLLNMKVKGRSEIKGDPSTCIVFGKNVRVNHGTKSSFNLTSVYSSPSTTAHKSYGPTKAVRTVGRSVELQSGLSPYCALTLAFAQAERGVLGSISLLSSDSPLSPKVI